MWPKSNSRDIILEFELLLQMSFKIINILIEPIKNALWLEGPYTKLFYCYYYRDNWRIHLIKCSCSRRNHLFSCDRRPFEDGLISLLFLSNNYFFKPLFQLFIIANASLNMHSDMRMGINETWHHHLAWAIYYLSFTFDIIRGDLFDQITLNQYILIKFNLSFGVLSNHNFTIFEQKMVHD